METRKSHDIEYYLAIDLGASSGRHILGHLSEGRLVTEEIYRFSNEPLRLPESGKTRLKWDIDRLWEHILEGLRRAGELGKTPVSVGIDTWGCDYVLLDEMLSPIDGAYCYRDERAERAIPGVFGRISREELYRRTGIQHASFNSIYQLYDDVCTGRMQNAEHFLMLPDYFAWKLTGVMSNEYTEATTTGLINAGTGTWDPEILKVLGIKESIFLKPSQPGTVLGHFSARIGSAVGYDAEVILPATHDTGSAIAAAPIEDGSPYLSSGTWSLLGIEQDRAQTSAEAMQSGYSNEGIAGGRVCFQKNIIGLWMFQEIRHELGDRFSFEELTRMAEEEPVPETFDVNQQKLMAPDSMIRALREELGYEASAGQMVYAVLASLAKCYGESLEVLEQLLGRRFDTLTVVGGGGKNRLLNRLTEEATGKRIIAGASEGSAAGNLILQMLAKGRIRDLNEGRKIIHG